MEGYQLEVIRKTWQERKQRKEQEEAGRKQDAIEKAKKAAVFLKDTYQVKNVYLFGSLVWGKHFTVSSDIDILIDDFSGSANYWEALAAVEHIARPFPISIVIAKNAKSSLVEKVKKEGMLL
ncbi:MAG: nucleotidyltransferase domain-containing protein [Clostridia bacterium]|nr:nucleotidyltransferase domain-containing protein [Clostridia bacterium]